MEIMEVNPLKQGGAGMGFHGTKDMDAGPPTWRPIRARFSQRCRVFKRVLARSALQGLWAGFQTISLRGRHNLCIGEPCGRRGWQPGPFAFRNSGSAVFDPWDLSRFSTL